MVPLLIIFALAGGVSSIANNPGLEDCLESENFQDCLDPSEFQDTATEDWVEEEGTSTNEIQKPATYQYFDQEAHTIAMRIQGMPMKLNKLLSLEKFKPAEKIIQIHLLYKSSAELVRGTECAVDENRFDYSFNILLDICAAAAGTLERRAKLYTGIRNALQEIQETDHVLYMNSKLLQPESYNPDGTTETGIRKAHESLQATMNRMVKLFQLMFHETKTAMKDCIKAETERLWGYMVDATKAIGRC